MPSSLRRRQARRCQHLLSRMRQGVVNQPLRHPLQVRHLRGRHRLRRARDRPPELQLPDLPHRCQRQEQCPLLPVLPGRARYQARYQARHWVRLRASRPGPEPIRRPIREQIRCQASPKVWPQVKQQARNRRVNRQLPPGRPRHHLPLQVSPARARRELVRQSPQSCPPPDFLPDCRPERPCLPGLLLPVRPLQLPHLALALDLKWRRVLASQPRQMPVPLPQLQPPPVHQRRPQALLLPPPLLAPLPASTGKCQRPRLLQTPLPSRRLVPPCPVLRRRRSFGRWRAAPDP